MLASGLPPDGIMPQYNHPHVVEVDAGELPPSLRDTIFAKQPREGGWRDKLAKAFTGTSSLSKRKIRLGDPNFSPFAREALAARDQYLDEKEMRGGAKVNPWLEEQNKTHAPTQGSFDSSRRTGASSAGHPAPPYGAPEKPMRQQHPKGYTRRANPQPSEYVYPRRRDARTGQF